MAGYWTQRPTIASIPPYNFLGREWSCLLQTGCHECGKVVRKNIRLAAEVISKATEHVDHSWIHIQEVALAIEFDDRVGTFFRHCGQTVTIAFQLQFVDTSRRVSNAATE